MVRSSKSVTAQHRDEILDVAARRVKQDGVDGVTIPEVMREAGMTPGGFYTHFDSKDHLTEQAVQRAFEIQRSELREISAAWDGDHSGASDAFADMYITRVDPERLARACPISALVGDVARSPIDSPLRPLWADEVRQTLAIIASLGDDGEAVSDSQRAEAIVRAATLLGTAVLARSLAGDPLADEISATVRQSLFGSD